MSQPAVRDLKLVSERNRSDLLDSVRLAWSNWAANCLPSATIWTPTFDVHPVAEALLSSPGGGAGDWQARGGQALAGWSQWSERGRQQLAARLVQRGPSAPALPEGDWALAAADRAWSALNEQLLGPAMHAPDESDALPDTRPWSGVVFITEPVLDARWAWRVPAPASTVPLEPIRRSVIDCVRHRSLRLRADLGEVDITLADLLALQVGDVVRFPSTDRQGVPFQVGDSNRIAGHGQLGMIDGHLALRLSSLYSARS